MAVELLSELLPVKEEVLPEPHLPLQSGLTTGVELPHELSRGAARISGSNYLFGYVERLTCEALATRATADGALRSGASNTCRAASGFYTIAAGRTFVKSNGRIEGRGLGDRVGIYEGGEQKDQAYSDGGECATHLNEWYATAVKDCATTEVKN